MMINNKIKAVFFTFITLVIIIGFLELFSFVAIKAFNKLKGTNYSPSVPQEALVWWEYCPVLGIKPKPNIPAFESSDNSAPRMGTDRYGFAHNGDPRRVLMPKPPNTYRVFMLGGSTVWGSGVSSNKQTLAAQMERMLNDNSRYQFRFEVINAGVPGYISYEEFSYLSKEILYYQPDMIVVLDGINDFYYGNHDVGIMPNISHHQMLQMKAWDNEGVPAALVHLKGFFSSICPACVNAWKNVYVTVRYRSNLIYLTGKLAKKVKSGLKVKSKPAVNTVTANDFNPVYIDCYIQNIKNIVGVCKANGLDLILIFQPTLGSVHKDHLTDKEIALLSTIDRDWEIPDLKNMLPRYYELVAKKFDKLKGQYADDDIWIGNFEGVFKDVKDTVYSDQIHYNEIGNKILAEKINSVIVSKFADKMNKKSKRKE